MVMKKFLVIMVSLITMAGLAAPAGATYTYFNDFEGDPHTWTGWSHKWQATTPSGRKFLGIFANHEVTFDFPPLPFFDSPTTVRIEFDLFILRSWDGNDLFWGPDKWMIVFQRSILSSYTFSNGFGGSQSYPGSYPRSSNPPRTGAEENDTLGYGEGGWGDSVYHIVVIRSGLRGPATFRFVGNNLQGWDDEGWGLDNFRLTAIPASQLVPLPGTLLLLIPGLAGLLLWRRRQTR